jgi:hypothetical protein
MKISFVRSSIVKRWLRDVKADQSPGWASTSPQHPSICLEDVGRLVYDAQFA